MPSPRKEFKLLAIPGLLFATAFISIFLIVGIGVALGGYVGIRDLGVFEKTPIIDVSNIKEGQIIKILIEPDINKLVKSPHSGLDCVFYQLDYSEYYNSDDSVSKDTYETKKEPDMIRFKNNNKTYTVFLNDPSPMKFFTNNITYFYNRHTKEYQRTTKTKFRSGNKILEEMMILPGEKVMLFGKLSKIIDSPADNSAILQFNSSDIGNPFDDTLMFFDRFSSIIFKNELTFYIITTQPAEEVVESINSKGSNFMIIFGLVFCIVPLIILLSLWSDFIKLFFEKL